MMPHTKKTLAAMILAVATTGCAGTNTTSKETEPTNKKALNQPLVEELVTLGEMQSDTPQPSKALSAGESRSVISYNAEPPMGTQSAEIYVENTTSHLVTSNWNAQNKPLAVRPYEVRKGDSYAEIIAQWLRNNGYTNVTTKLVKADQRVLDLSAKNDAVIVDTLPQAIESIIEEAAARRGKNDINGFYISYNGTDATIYSATPEILVHHKGEKPQPFANPLFAYKGETYESALTRWLNESGYQRVGKLLNKSTQEAINQRVMSTAVFNESLEKAATLLLYTARLQAQKDERSERDNFLSDEQKANIEHHLYLDAAKKEAILTSSNKPVVMFNVQPGSLKANFLALAKLMNYQANSAHYMAPEYEITFGYPIVAEQGNIKDALALMLKDFPKQRGAIVPSTRQAYIMTEE